MTMGARINVSFYQAPYVSLLFVFVFVSSLLPCALCVDGDDYSQTGNPALLPIVTNLVYSELSNLSKALKPDIEKKLDFCIIDLKADWDGAFDFTKQLDFLTECVKKTKGDLRQRLCTAAEIKFYFSSFSGTDENHANYLKPNKNCNLSSWVSGCEPGWGCTINGNQKVDLKTSQTIPPRTNDCQPCCEGFFCPMGLTCMIPCPLGSHCPPGKLNKTTGNCAPYSYQLPPGKPDHACGGADIWTDVVSSNDIFCAPGSYCPTTTRKVSCSSGHYCRKGSTSQKRCFPLTTCNPNSSNQNIHAYGVLLIAMLSLALLICYNCSDQVLTTRERRAAKKREAAARQARETAQARERWKAAKNIAKKGGFSGLQQSLSRTFSRTKSKRDQLKNFGQSKRGTDTSLLPTVPSGSGSEEQSKNNEPGSLTKMVHDIENDPASHQGFQMDIGDKNIKKQAPRGKKLHTQSQIFKYAYGQIEKEKAMQQQNKNITFSGVISMATDNDMRTRPVIEVAFKDLTLTLKGKNKHLLRSVTGKLMPGRVSAVMGPSGAGKTTFLSALLGKASGCTITGMILVNGKDEPIQSYRRIIGFVPQDDIVHGDLTVEENLRFNARCRLPADMPKADKVLIVERVIESLGLQNVRDSLVGTVERRGISGGQRKRVNVGIEMVIEPSVLILDEPTSGLDSASSQLLLRALRREALEGVNITMVVHQPSYALFKMFDDLILLAKGGLTVYHGSVKKVEEYFSGLGIIVPERVNPPDHFIDILEGIIKPSSVTREQLPVRWMLHNGYPVPPDMLKLLDDTASSSNDSNPIQLGSSTEQTFAAWNAEQKRDSTQRIKDLSNRTTPGVTRQYRYFLGRVIKQRLREAKIQAVDFMLLLVAGACLGTLATVTDETFGSLGYTYTVIAVSLLCKISALRSFTVDRLEYQRESASGISSLAYFMSKDTIDHFNTVIKPLVYLSMFFFFNNPRSTFQDNYAVLLCLVYCVTGMAYILAIYLEPGPAQLCSVLIPVVLTLIASQDKESFMVKHLGDFIYPKWALEAFVVANARRYSGVWLITRCTSLMTSGYNLHDWTLCLIVLLCMGVICRVVAFCLLMRIKK